MQMTHGCTSPYRKKAVNDAVTNLQNCLSEVPTWFSQNGLVINPEKSEAVLLTTTQNARASSLPLTDVNVAGCVVPLADTVKLLGVTIDRRLTFDEHVQNVCKSAYYHIRALKHIRSSLSTDMAKTVASALVNSRLDYANSVLYNTSSGKPGAGVMLRTTVWLYVMASSAVHMGFPPEPTQLFIFNWSVNEC
jgi:hypothetical protein